MSIKQSQSIEINIKKMIIGHGHGWCMTPWHFQDLGNSGAIRVALHRLEKSEFIRRVAQGIYDYPRLHETLGVLPPDINKIAKAISERNHIKIQPSGAYAANLLGLSEQVPSRIVFVTDGPSKKIKIGKQEIIFRKTTAKNMANAGTTLGIIIQAMKHLGKNKITNSAVQKLKNHIKDLDKKIIKKGIEYAPNWIYEKIIKLKEYHFSLYFENFLKSSDIKYKLLDNMAHIGNLREKADYLIAHKEFGKVIVEFKEFQDQKDIQDQSKAGKKIIGGKLKTVPRLKDRIKKADGQLKSYLNQEIPLGTFVCSSAFFDPDLEDLKEAVLGDFQIHFATNTKNYSGAYRGNGAFQPKINTTTDFLALFKINGPDQYSLILFHNIFCKRILPYGYFNRKNTDNSIQEHMLELEPTENNFVKAKFTLIESKNHFESILVQNKPWLNKIQEFYERK